jgi:hypothetical protein
MILPPAKSANRNGTGDSRSERVRQNLFKITSPIDRLPNPAAAKPVEKALFQSHFHSIKQDAKDDIGDIIYDSELQQSRDFWRFT